MGAIATRLSNGGQRSAVGGPLLWLSWLFTGLALTQLALVNNDLGLTTFLPLVVLIVCSTLSAYLVQRRRQPGDPILLPLIFFLSGLGLVLIARLAPAFVLPQLAWLVMATVALLGVVLLPRNFDWLRRYKYAWLTGGLILLAATLIFGVNPAVLVPVCGCNWGRFIFSRPNRSNYCLSSSWLLTWPDAAANWSRLRLTSVRSACRIPPIGDRCC
ncbi:MAG: hypothetical protein HC875_09750 [Anaerolineales bacterium]|nr:hypothetical protein [Anaerolineales bacterium]